MKKMKLIDRMGKGELVMQLSTRMSADGIRQEFHRKGYVWNGKVPSASAISDYIKSHQEQGPNFLRTENYIIITIEEDEPRYYHTTGKDAAEKVRTFVDAFGISNVQLCRVVPLSTTLLIGDQGGEPAGQDD